MNLKLNGTEIRAKLVHLRTIFQGFQPLAQTYFSAIHLKLDVFGGVAIATQFRAKCFGKRRSPFCAS
jgi:hypothetical protein